LLTTPLHEAFHTSLQFQDPQSPQLLSASDTGQGLSTISPGDLLHLGRSAAYNGSYDHKPRGELSSGYNPETYLEDSLLPSVPLQLRPSHPRAIGHRTLHSEPHIPSGSLLMQENGPDMHHPPPIQTDGTRHYRSYSESNNDLLSPDSSQSLRGRRERRGSRSQSRRSSPYPRFSPSQESFPDTGSGESYLSPELSSPRHRTPNSGSASFPGTPIIGSCSEASASTQSLVSPSTSIMIMNHNTEFNDMLSGVGMTPRKVGSEKLDEASNKRRKNEAKHICQLCGRALTTKHNVKSSSNFSASLFTALTDCVLLRPPEESLRH
jgi:hypothetical protein